MFSVDIYTSEPEQGKYSSFLCSRAFTPVDPAGPEPFLKDHGT